MNRDATNSSPSLWNTDASGILLCKLTAFPNNQHGGQCPLGPESFPLCCLLKSYGVFLYSVLCTKVSFLLQRGRTEEHNLLSEIFNSLYISSTKERQLPVCMSMSQLMRKTTVCRPEPDNQTPATNCSPETAEAEYKRKKK